MLGAGVVTSQSLGAYESPMNRLGVHPMARNVAATIHQILDSSAIHILKHRLIHPMT
jgi:hypothetical protein